MTPSEWVEAAVKQADAARMRVAIVEVEHLRALLSEREALRAGLGELLEMPGGQEVVSTDGLRIGGESGGIVHNGSFDAVHVEDLAARVEALLAIGGGR